jgi:hypothetical protein
VDPEPGHEDADGPPPPPPEALARSASGWVPPSEPVREVGADRDAAGGTTDAGQPAHEARTTRTGGAETGATGTGAAETGGRWTVGAPPAPTGTVPARRRRWPLVLAGLLVVVLAGTLLALALTADEESVVAGDDGNTPGTAPDGDDDGAGEDGDLDGPGPDGAPDTELDPLDLDRLDGLDLVYGRLLTDVDASEREMISFQTDVGEALSGATSGPEGLAAVAEVAAAREQGLLAVRDRLEDPLDDAGAEEVRQRYVEHLDSWADFMGAVAEDPLLILEQSESGATVAINRTADRFARALEAELPDDIDAEVARFADGVLDRGFRGFGVADV